MKEYSNKIVKSQLITYMRPFDKSCKYYEDFIHKAHVLAEEVSKYNETLSSRIEEFTESLCQLINFVAPSYIPPEEDEKYKEENE